MPVKESNQQVKAQGVYADLHDLLRCRLLARELNLNKQRKILGPQAGLHTSSFRGRGVDFSEVRAYQHGDDIRSIDWRVTARTGKPHTKLYSEERERPALVLLDQSRSMYFGSREAFKSVRAAQCAALLSWAALARGDRVGGIVFSESNRSEIRPRRSHHNVLQLIENIISFNHALSRHVNNTSTRKNQNALTESLNHARRITKPGSELFIISDFISFDESARQHLYQLSRHNDLVCIRVYDELEMHPPGPGLYTVTDGNHRMTFNLFDKKTRDNYEKLIRQRTEQLNEHLEQMKIPLVPMATNQLPLQTLQTGLGIRGRVR